MNLSVLNLFFQKGENLFSTNGLEGESFLDSPQKNNQNSFLDLFSKKMEESAFDQTFCDYPQESSSVAFTQKEIAEVNEHEIANKIDSYREEEGIPSENAPKISANSLQEEKKKEEKDSQAVSYKKENQKQKVEEPPISPYGIFTVQNSPLKVKGNLLQKEEKVTPAISKKNMAAGKSFREVSTLNQGYAIGEKILDTEKEKKVKSEESKKIVSVQSKEKIFPFDEGATIEKLKEKQLFANKPHAVSVQGVSFSENLKDKIKVVKLSEKTNGKEMKAIPKSPLPVIEKNIMADLTKEGHLKENSSVGEFQSKMVRYLQDTGMDRIVNQAKMILKEGNRGEINLMLRPEQLGRVKIHLNFEEDRVVGKIVVENQMVKESFKEIASDLSKALMEKGFEQANLEIAFFQSHHENQMGENRKFSQENGTLTNHWEKPSDISNESARSSYYQINQETALDLIV